MNKLLFIILLSFTYTISSHDIYDNSWALIIGIDKYDNVRELNYAVKDAESIREILSTSFDFPVENITILKNKNATKQNILKSLSEITKQSGERDRVLVFFAGHGDQEDLPEGGQMGYLLPVDGNPDDLYLTSIGMDEFKKLSYRSNAKHLLYLVDACYGGIAAVSSRGLDTKTPNYLEKITKDKSRQIITAGGRGEEVIEKTEWGHSAFTLNLIRGLKDGRADMNSNGFITANELGLFLRDKVTIDSENQQTPQYGRLTTHEGEFVFITKSNFKLDDLGSIQSVQTSRGLATQIPQAFKSGTSIMSPHMTKSLDYIVEKLNNNSHKLILIESHTDNALPTGYNSIVYSDNWKLSLARADETFNYLLSKGISAEKIIALGYADRWPFGITWEDIGSNVLIKSKIALYNDTANKRAKNRRINIIISQTELEREESMQSITYNQNLFESVYKKIIASISSNNKNISYKLIIVKLDESYSITSSFPPIVGPNTGQLMASIPHFIMQAPTDGIDIEQWMINISDLENGLSDWEINAAVGDSLTQYWGLLGEYYFKFYAQ
jgi:flagellar motor protein MotB